MPPSECSVVGSQHMPGQVHAVVKQAQDIDALILGLSEHHKMTPASAPASHVQRTDAGLDIFACFDTQLFWPVMQRLDGQSQRLCVSLGLAFAKVLNSLGHGI